MNFLSFLFFAATPIADAILTRWDSPGVVIGKLAVIAALVALNGFFVACEFAIVKVRASQLDTLVEEGNLRASFAKYVRGHLDAVHDQVNVTRDACAVHALIEPEEERRQWVFHVMVSERYTDWRESQMLAGEQPAQGQTEASQTISEIE